MTEVKFLKGRVLLHPGDCMEVIKTIADSSIDSVVTDPPYALVSIVKRFGKPGSAPPRDGDVYSRSSAGFMGQRWDNGDVAFDPAFWIEVLRVLKPGGHVVALGGTRTYHRLACAIEDAGFEIRDQLAWVYGSGFPKSHDVSKGIDRASNAEREVIGPPPYRRGKAGNSYSETRKVSYDYPPLPITAPATDAARQWQGWGTALKPSYEPICLARKPLIGTVAANVLQHSTGALNIDGCRVEGEGGQARIGEPSQDRRYSDKGSTNFAATPGPRGGAPEGRWPANLVHDGSDEVLAAFPDSAGQQGDVRGNEPSGPLGVNDIYRHMSGRVPQAARNDTGSAARFFYTAKADAHDRIGSRHPTVKPVNLMQWLVRLVTPKGGTVLDPFAGTGTTGEAAWREGMSTVLIEREADYRADIARRMELIENPAKRRSVAKAKGKPMGAEGTPLFDDIGVERLPNGRYRAFSKKGRGL